MNRRKKITKAVHILDLFTKTWCVAESPESEEPEFECENCQFNKGRFCVIKQFAYTQEHDYPMDDFGSMN